MSAGDGYKIFIDKTVTNLEKDRMRALSIYDLLKVRLNNPTTVDECTKLAAIAAKCVETMQRSNEQMLKAASTLQKGIPKEEDVDIDSEELFDILSTEESTDPPEEEKEKDINE